MQNDSSSEKEREEQMMDDVLCEITSHLGSKQHCITNDEAFTADLFEHNFRSKTMPM